MVDPAKIFLYLGIIAYFIVFHGQNLIEFDTELRKDFYFVGMAASNAMLAFVLFRFKTSCITAFWLAYSISEVLNEILFNGDITYLSSLIGIAGTIFYLIKENNGEHRYL